MFIVIVFYDYNCNRFEKQNKNGNTKETHFN